MSTTSLIQPDRELFSYKPYWAECFGPAPFLPMSREEMDQLGWDSCDVIIISGDAYVDHPSFGMAIIGRMLEAQASASASSRSRTGATKKTSCVWANRTCSSASPPAIWIR